MYSYDLYGWYTDVPNIARSTDIKPPKTTGIQKANWTGVEWVIADYSEPVVIAPVIQTVRVISKLQYMNRFTDIELATIYTAAKSVVQVEIWLEKFKLASDINLDDPATVGGLQAMEAATLIGVGRAAEILA